jgi:HEPN domain-containing protein
MSTEKNLKEAARWLTTAGDDLDTARILQKNGKYAHACFHAQQAGEKAVKALWYYSDADPWGHSIKKLIGDLDEVDTKLYNSLKDLEKTGVVLDRFYIPTRYPNGLPDITPDIAFTEEDATTCINNSQKILQRVKELLHL